MICTFFKHDCCIVTNQVQGLGTRGGDGAVPGPGSGRERTAKCCQTGGSCSGDREWRQHVLHRQVPRPDWRRLLSPALNDINMIRTRFIFVFKVCAVYFLGGKERRCSVVLSLGGWVWQIATTLAHPEVSACLSTGRGVGDASPLVWLAPKIPFLLHGCGCVDRIFEAPSLHRLTAHRPPENVSFTSFQLNDCLATNRESCARL